MNKYEQIRRDFLIERDTAGREKNIYQNPYKEYLVEWIRNGHSVWEDFDSVTKPFTDNYDSKNIGSITPKESVITKENGYE